ncbi:GntR family transcriptional regulator [Bordetella sp. 2513F-2]
MGRPSAIADPREGRRAGVTVSEVYKHLKEMVVLYRIKPGERVNEVELAERLGVSRTPLREALHRLVAEDMLTMVPNRGFYGRRLERQEVFELYELRSAIELAAVNLALVRASDADIQAMRDDWVGVMRQSERLSTYQLLIEDERFHLCLARLSGNREIAKSLRAINARIHYFRWSDLEDRGAEMGRDHLALADALLARDHDTCRRLIDAHIARRMDEIVRFIQNSVLRLYAGDI